MTDKEYNKLIKAIRKGKIVTVDHDSIQEIEYRCSLEYLRINVSYFRNKITVRRTN